MIVIYDSLTGQGERMAQKIGLPYVDIREYQGDNTEILLITRSFNFGEITAEAKDFLEKYAKDVIGVTVSGNRNWGTNFGAAGDKIQKLYGIELISKFEGSGFPQDVDCIKQWIQMYKDKKYVTIGEF